MSAQQFKIHRVTALPQPLEAYAVYLVAPPGNEDYVEMYVSNNTGTKARRIIKEEDIIALIKATIGESVKPISEIKVIADAEELKTLDDPSVIFVYVKDATDVEGADVTSGGATFIKDGDSWTKVSEAESLDISLNWDSIEGKPNVSKEDIETAVAQKHEHSNISQLNKIGEDGVGNFTYGGNPVATAWSSTAW